MAKFTVILTNPAHLAGLAAARERHNVRVGKDALPLFSDNEFIQHMVERAAERYAQEFARGDNSPVDAPRSDPETLESKLAASLAAELLPNNE
jgi:hypothetical protein